MKVIFPITFNALFNYPLRYSLLWLCFLLKHYTQHRARKLSLKKISLLLWCSVIAILLISIILMRIFCIKSCKNCTTKSLSLFSFSNFFFLSLNSCQTCKNLKNFILFIFHHHQKSELKRAGRGDLINSLNENFSRLFSANSTFQKLYKKAYESKKKMTENNFQWEKFFSIIAVKKSEKMNGMERERHLFSFRIYFSNSSRSQLCRGRF